MAFNSEKLWKEHKVLKSENDDIEIIINAKITKYPKYAMSLSYKSDYFCYILSNYHVIFIIRYQTLKTGFSESGFYGWLWEWHRIISNVTLFSEIKEFYGSS